MGLCGSFWLPCGPHWQCVSLFHHAVVCAGGSLEALAFSSAGPSTWLLFSALHMVLVNIAMPLQVQDDGSCLPSWGMQPLRLLVANSAARSYAQGLGIPESQMVCMAHLCVLMLWYPEKNPCELSCHTSTFLPNMGQIVCNNLGCSSTGRSLLHTTCVVPMLLALRRNTIYLCFNGGAHCLVNREWWQYWRPQFNKVGTTSRTDAPVKTPIST